MSMPAKHITLTSAPEIFREFGESAIAQVTDFLIKIFSFWRRIVERFVRFGVDIIQEQIQPAEPLA